MKKTKKQKETDGRMDIRKYRLVDNQMGRVMWINTFPI